MTVDSRVPFIFIVASPFLRVRPVLVTSDVSTVRGRGPLRNTEGPQCFGIRRAQKKAARSRAGFLDACAGCAVFGAVLSRAAGHVTETATEPGRRIVGREAEVSALHAFLQAEVVSGSLVIVGAPGIGKT